MARRRRPTKHALYTELVKQLTAVRGKRTKERAAIQVAVSGFMTLAARSVDHVEIECVSFFSEGDGTHGSAFDAVPDVTDGELMRWYDMLVQAVGAHSRA